MAILEQVMQQLPCQARLPEASVHFISVQKPLSFHYPLVNIQKTMERSTIFNG